MKVEEFYEVLKKSLRIVNVGIEKGYFKQEDKDMLSNKLLEVRKNGIESNIQGTAIYGMYDPGLRKLNYNAKVFKDEQEALIYILHEMKHALDDNGLSIGFDLKNGEKGVGRNEGATQRFATDIAEEILGEKIPETMQSSLGITLKTNLDEYQIEDKLNELFCKALGISRAEFLSMQNERDLATMNKLKERFNQYADFDVIEKALDGIYAIQEETWIDENGNLLEQETEPTPEQTARAKKLIRQYQSQIIQFVERSNPEMLDEIKEEIIMIDGEIMADLKMLFQDDYLKYQDFITRGLDLGDYTLVYVSGLGDFPFEEIYEGESSMKQLLENYKKTLTENVYLRKGDEYKKIEVTFDKTGVIGMSEKQEVISVEEILGDLEESDSIGNAEEYIKILRLQGKNEQAQEVEKKYEYFMNNRDRMPEFKENVTEMMKSGRIASQIFLDEEPDEEEFEPDEGEISYNGITISSDGWGMYKSGIVVMQIPKDIIDSIELAIKQGELILTEKQRETLLSIKCPQVGVADFQEVAGSSIEEKNKISAELKAAQKTNEDKNKGE